MRLRRGEQGGGWWKTSTCHTSWTREKKKRNTIKMEILVRIGTIWVREVDRSLPMPSLMGKMGLKKMVNTRVE